MVLIQKSEIFGEIAKTREETRKGMSRKGIGPVQGTIRRMERPGGNYEGGNRERNVHVE